MWSGMAAFSLLDWFAMAFVADSLASGSGVNVWPQLFGAALASLLLLGVIARLTPSRFRYLWHRHYTTTDHFKECVWPAGTYNKYGPTLDDSRACALEVFRPELWCKDEVGEWLREGWSGWTADPPIWFTDERVAGIPSDLRPSVSLSDGINMPIIH